MKKLKPLFTFLFVLSTTTLFSQSASLTKEETVKYIEKKMKESEGHYRTIDLSGFKKLFYYLNNSTISLINGNVVISYSQSTYPNTPREVPVTSITGGSRYAIPCDYAIREYKMSFNPAHIIKIEKAPNYSSQIEPVGGVLITLLGQTANRTYNYAIPSTSFEDEYYTKRCQNFKYQPEIKESVNQVFIPYLQSDPTNYDKIFKALNYLRDLYKAEDDPFGQN